MLSSTVSPPKSRDCWYVRARPSFARFRDGMRVTSWPNSSTVPDVAGKSPAITLNSVVLPAPFGPRIARRSPVHDVEIDIAHSVKAAEAPADPPQAEGRRGAFGVTRRTRCLCRHLTILPLTTGFSLPVQGSAPTLQVGNERPGGGVDGLNVPPNVWSTFGMN